MIMIMNMIGLSLICTAQLQQCYFVIMTRIMNHNSWLLDGGKKGQRTLRKNIFSWPIKLWKKRKRKPKWHFLTIQWNMIIGWRSLFRDQWSLITTIIRGWFNHLVDRPTQLICISNIKDIAHYCRSSIEKEGGWWLLSNCCTITNVARYPCFYPTSCYDWKYHQENLGRAKVHSGPVYLQEQFEVEPKFKDDETFCMVCFT